MYAVPAWRGLTSEGDRALIEILYHRLQRMGYLPRDTPGTLALVERADDSLFWSIQKNPAHVLHHQQSNNTMVYVLDLTTMSSRWRTTKTLYPTTCIS